MIEETFASYIIFYLNKHLHLTDKVW